MSAYSPPEPEIVEVDIPKLHNVELERGVIGVILEGSAMFRAVSEVLEADDFFVHRNQWIFKAVGDLVKKNLEPDMQLVIEEVRDQDVDYAYLIACIRDAPSFIDTTLEYAAKIHEYAQRRKLMSLANSLATGLFDTTKPVGAILGESLTFMQDMSAKGLRSRSVAMRDAAGQLYDHVEKIMKNGETGTWMTGLVDFDRILGGLAPGRSGLIGARPKVGKTALMLTIIASLCYDFRSNSTRWNKPRIVLNSMEMTVEAITQRLAAIVGGIDSEKIQRGKLDDQELIRFNDAISEIGSWPVVIIDERNPAMLASKIAQMVAMGECDILFNDYIGKFEARAENRVRQVAIASNTISRMAVQLNIPIITAAQVSRDVDTRGKDSKLVLRDLKESGDLEQDADWVLFMNRNSENPRVIDCDLAANRHGPSGTFALLFQRSYTRFVNATARKVEPLP